MVEGARLESVYTGNRIEGSNPSPSAKTSYPNILPCPADSEKLRELKGTYAFRLCTTPSIGFVVCAPLRLSFSKAVDYAVSVRNRK